MSSTTPVVDVRLNHIGSLKEVTITESYGRINMEWTGTFTFGMSWVRGSSFGLTDTGGSRLAVSDSYYYEDNNVVIKGDFQDVRAESIKELIQKLTADKTKYSTVVRSFAELEQILVADPYVEHCCLKEAEFAEDINKMARDAPDLSYYIDSDGPLDVFLVRDTKGLLAELTQLDELVTKYNVTQEWI